MAHDQRARGAAVCRGREHLAEREQRALHQRDPRRRPQSFDRTRPRRDSTNTTTPPLPCNWSVPALHGLPRAARGDSWAATVARAEEKTSASGVGEIDKRRRQRPSPRFLQVAHVLGGEPWMTGNNSTAQPNSMAIRARTPIIPRRRKVCRDQQPQEQPIYIQPKGTRLPVQNQRRRSTRACARLRTRSRSFCSPIC